MHHQKAAGNSLLRASDTSCSCNDGNGNDMGESIWLLDGRQSDNGR